MVTGISSSARQEKETDDFCRTRSRSCCLLCPPYCVSWEWHLLLQVYLCSLYREAPRPLDMGHGSSTFLLVAGSTRRQKRCSSSSVFPKYNPEIFSWCFWLKNLQKLDLHHRQTTAPRGADNSLSNVVSVDLKMRFASAILCGIWSPLMSRNWSEWNLSSTAQLLTPEQVVGTGSFILLCWNTGWYIIDEWKMCYVCWLYLQITTLITADSPGTSSGPNSALYLQETYIFLITDVFTAATHNIPSSTDEKWGK